MVCFHHARHKVQLGIARLPSKTWYFYLMIMSQRDHNGNSQSPLRRMLLSAWMTAIILACFVFLIENGWSQSPAEVDIAAQETS